MACVEDLTAIGIDKGRSGKNRAVQRGKAPSKYRNVTSVLGKSRRDISAVRIRKGMKARNGYKEGVFFCATLDGKLAARF